MSSEYRKGFEFSQSIRNEARLRSGGICQWPRGCNQFHDGTVDHKVSIAISFMQGALRENIKSQENAQVLCYKHNQRKMYAEAMFMQAIYNIDYKKVVTNGKRT